jgi:hypothetical protein
MVDFYHLADGANMPSIHTSYRIYSLQELLEADSYLPIRVEGEHAGRILTFGETAGADYFAIRIDEPYEILVLPYEGYGIDNGIYSEDMEPVHVVASDFNGFLEHLLRDVKASVSNDDKWDYMANG